MLNVAWLNGATPLGKGGGASSGGSSGGSGSGGGSEEPIAYYDIRGMQEWAFNNNLLHNAAVVFVYNIYYNNTTWNGAIPVGLYFYMRQNIQDNISNNVLGIGICKNLLVTNPFAGKDEISLNALLEYCASVGVSLKEITKEEFYNLDNDNALE